MESVRKFGPQETKGQIQLQNTKFNFMLQELCGKFNECQEIDEIQDQFKEYINSWESLCKSWCQADQNELDKKKSILKERTDFNNRETLKLQEQNKYQRNMQRDFKNRMNSMSTRVTRISKLQWENLENVSSSITRRQGKHKDEIKRVLEGTNCEQKKPNPKNLNLALRLDKVRKDPEDELISHRSVFMSNRSKLSRIPSQPITKRSEKQSVNGSILTIGSNLLDQLDAQWQGNGDRLGISMTKNVDGWASEFDSFEQSEQENQVEFEQIKKALEILARAKLLENEEFIPKVNDILAKPDASANLALMLQMISMNPEGIPDTKENRKSMRTVMETLSEHAASTPPDSVLPSPISKSASPIDDATANDPEIGVSFRDVKLEDILAECTPLRKRRAESETKELNTKELNVMSTNDLEKIKSECQAKGLPHKRTGTMDYYSTSTTDASLCLKSKSIFRNNSSGYSNLKFDSQGMNITPVTRDIAQKLVEM